MASQEIGQATGAHVKKLIVASVVIAAVALSAPVRAADFPPYSVAKGPIIGSFDWEGFYVGGHIGSATDNTSFTQTNVGWTSLPGGLCCGFSPSGTSNVSTGKSGSLGSTNVTGGLQVGYNWLIPRVVPGRHRGRYLRYRIELDHADLAAGNSAAVASWTEKLDVYGSVRARLGWVANDWLFYGTGGFGWAYDKFTRNQLTAPFSNVNPPFVDINALQAGSIVTSSHFRPGWVVGAGVEWAVARTWTVKLEYLHFDTTSETLSSGHFSALGPGLNNQTSASVTANQGNLTIDTVRVGFNHTFN